jgi:hypothetical protein
VTTVRRVYVYLVALASLLMMGSGAGGLGRVILLRILDASQATLNTNLRSAAAENGALVLVGLPVWLLHWTMANRAARRDRAERTATLRRLYLYAVLTITSLIAANGAYESLRALARGLLGNGAGAVDGVLLPLPATFVAAALWVFHARATARDRTVAGETGGSATLRRWYVYGVAFVGLIVLVRGASALFAEMWRSPASVADQALAGRDAALFAGPIAATLVGLLLWLPHWTGRVVAAQRPSSKVAAQDARSTLRPVYLFLALAVSVGVTLYGTSQLLYYALARALGVDRPGGVGGSLLLAMAGPVGQIAVYGTSWLYHRAAVAAQARSQAELPRQAGVRRLYTYLVALVALSLLAAGAGGVLWTIADVATNARHTVDPDTWWRGQISLYVTLLITGLPVWFAHWGPMVRRRTPEEAHALSRRLYLYLTLLAGVLALLGAGAALAKQILDLVLGDAATTSAITNVARAAAVAAVAGLVVYYHQRILRADVAATAAADRTAGRAGAAPSGTKGYVVILVSDGAANVEWFAGRVEATAAFNRGKSDDAQVTLARIEDVAGPAPDQPAASPPDGATSAAPSD